ncbi:phage portal protein [Aneurinibacillus migulanus]|uniref:phage portal protein n=1 Tax=Aneurinibacillus migulanus TaxID=47500 RepID=UPI0009BBCFC9|nr:phage portal protein [Aneurinibacillus migulanus]
MKLRHRIKTAWNVLTNNVKAAGSDFSKWFSGGKPISFGKAGETLATNETIFSAVTRLSNAMASLPLKLYKDFSPVNTDVSDLLANAPNPNMSSFDFIRTLETHRDTSGNGYAMKKYDNKYQVESLWVLDPTRVTPVIERNTRELWYEIDGDAGRYYVHNMDIIHVKHIHTTGYKGISPLEVLRNTIDFDKEVRQFSLDTMDGAVKASFLLKMATHLSVDKKKEVLANFKSFYQENGGVLIQESGVEIEPIKRDFMDTKVFEVEKITRSRVATVYNMPVHMLGETEGVNYNSMEQLSLDFVQNTLIPIVRQYEQELNRKLLTPKERLRGLYYKFNVNALLRGDMQTRGEFYFKGVRSGLFKPNEVRAWEELPPEPGGEKLYLSGDLYPIDTPIENRKGVKTE